ncbi:uncharacterized protein MAM_04869 [Metarhizium album ARSEF 1941]|uniref:Lipid droplet-associated hydrolase n=1 Tax=Metarhizium album (strain ARSEF 1941) TaxID=1081103 RepID=A0A0B2WV12_METAS|nr:uncharacterized protein MAM_04869 [Metarhizium album ARSEF 1941]KHN97272.1 hypothetical protein MAM_04869 [Metarhizium album ARSEF 1941]
MLSSIWKPAAPLRSTKTRALIYFVCGNPGLIGFYADFLGALRNLLDTSQSTTAYDLYGRNLLGFCDREHEPFSRDNPPWDVQGQVDGIYQDVAARRAGDKPYDFVVLMGHSIGAYISVDIFHRHIRDPSRAPHLRLRHGLLLFPTIASLAQSRSGARFNYVRSLPTMEAHLATYAKALLGLFPRRTLRWIVQNVVGFSPRAADVTAEWLKSRDGVLQALHMGKSELDTIFEDPWDDELWEVSASAPALPAPRFFIFYGREDHWVANHVRDDFIERRRRAGEKACRTSITVDEGNIPHAFCTKEREWSFVDLLHGPGRVALMV